MTKRHSSALRICMECGEFLRVELWPWNGSIFVRTHGLCSDCLEHLSEAAREDDEAAPARQPEIVRAEAH